MFVFLDVLLGPSVDRSYLAGPDAAVAPVQWETTAPGHLRRVGILFHSVDCSNSYCIINVIVEEVYNIILHPKQSQVPFLNQQKRQIFSLSPALSLSLSQIVKFNFIGMTVLPDSIAKTMHWTYNTTKCNT